MIRFELALTVRQEGEFKPSTSHFMRKDNHQLRMFSLI